MADKNVKIDEVSVSNNNTATVNIESSEKQNEDTRNTQEITETEKLNAQISELTDKYLRLAAELENTRRRAALDVESNARNRAMSVAKKFLPVMDAIEAAQKHSPDDDGIKSMAMAMNDAFTQIGITKIESIGQILNPKFHNAIQVVNSSADEHKSIPNTIIEELQPGYMFGDSVLRTAMVIVSK